ncbi:MAG: hypothetical protein JW938_01280 [Candidatus Omnitrophica bacterium]|nr:hypothetical protein [Candidatus Omnitrophota bacterium]
MKRTIAVLIVGLLTVGNVVCGEAAIPEVMTYAGILTDMNGVALDGTYDLTIKLYETAAGGMPVWVNTYGGVPVDKGKFYLEFTPDVVFDKEYWLGFQVNGDNEMEPRQRLGTVPYAMNSKSTSLESVSIESEGSASLLQLKKISSTYDGEPIVDVANHSSDPAIKIQNGIDYAGSAIEIYNDKNNYQSLIYGKNWKADGLDTRGRCLYLVNKSYSPTAELKQCGYGTSLWVDKAKGGGYESLKVTRYTNGRAATIYQSSVGAEALLIQQSATSNAALKIEQTPRNDKPFVDIAGIFKIVKNDYVTDGIALKFGSRYVWIDGQDTMRVKRGMPISDYDGEIVGQQ